MRASVPRVFVVVVLLLATLSFAGERKKPAAVSIPDLSGNWRLDPVHSTARPVYLQANQIIIKLFGRQYQFEFRGGHKLLARDIYAVDGRERPSYNTRLAKGFVSAKVEKEQLLVTTRAALDPEGNQTFIETERWSLSPDKKTLTNKMSDGKLRIYQKQPDEPETEIDESEKSDDR